MSESFAEMFEESLANQDLRRGAVVTGTVVDIQSDNVIVHAGLKSEGIIPIEQFRNTQGDLEVEVGDEVEVSLEAVEDGFGETRLSREKAKRDQVWRRLEEAFEKEEIVKGVISGKVKGGFTVDIDDIRAFLPGSLVDVRPVRDPAYLEGKDLEFKVIKLDKRRNNVVVSRRAVVETEFSAEREAGLLHITDMAWKRVKHPSEIVNVGDEIDVKVLKFDRERNRVSLGMKQLGQDPWADLARRYPSSSRLFGKVTNIADYGCFVEIEDGVEGLVHVSEMDWTNKNVNPSKVVHIGQEVEVTVLDIDEERRRISLGIKQCFPNPWDEFAATHNKGTHVRGSIKSITDFGIFIGLEGGIDGLVHLSDISWNEPGEDAVRNYSKGEEIEAVVLSVDPERERISLGIKQLDKDPYSNFVAEHTKGSVVTGTVTEVDAKAAVVDLGDGVEGTLRASELSRDRIEDVRTVLNVGDEVKAKFMGVDRKNRTISLSIKAKDTEEEAAMLQDYGAESSEATTNLGDVLKKQMSSDE
jgi:small subunit ribosomal protein S1